MANVPPRSRAASASGTRSPEGAKRIAASSTSGGGWSAGVALAQPSSSASRLARAERVITWTAAPRWIAIWAARWAEPPKPYTPSRPPVRHRGAVEGAVPDDPGAQEGRRLLVVERVGQRVRVGLVDDRELRVAPVVVPPGEARGHAEVLVPSSAEPAGTAGVAEPRDADAIAEGEAGRTDATRHHPADDLVTGHDRRPVGREVALGHVQIGAADPAHGHLHQHLGRCRFGHGPLDRPQRPAHRRGPAARPPTPACTVSPRRQHARVGRRSQPAS